MLIGRRSIVTTLERLQRILHEDFEIQSDALGRDTRLEALGIDSLKTIEILFRIEDAFGIRIPSVQEQPVQALHTVGDLSDLVDALVAALPVAREAAT
jgi:acyl carrier protein